MKQNRCISLLGSTSSIGRQSLDVIAACDIRVVALAADRDVEQMEKQCRRFQPELAVMMGPESATSLCLRLADTPIHVTEGIEGLLETVSLETANTVLTTVVGVVELRPTLAAIRTDKYIALANKETLMYAGELVGDAAAWSGSQVVPMDSEHSTIFQYLQDCQGRGEVRRLILTASGGLFWGRRGGDLAGVTVKQILTHPDWNMGAKISVNSAAMMNKGLEFIEAMRPYHTPPKKTSIVVHRESVVHSLVEYCNHAMLVQLGVLDVRLPIQYVLTWSGRVAAMVEPLDLLSCPPLTFHAPDYAALPCLALALEATRTGGAATAMLNGANEEAVEQSLPGQLSFSGIAEQMAYAVVTIPAVRSSSLGDILDASQAAREAARRHRPNMH